jgi:hypothetical protein
MTMRVAGEYLVRITIDGTERKCLPLDVAATRETGGPEPTRYLA